MGNQQDRQSRQAMEKLASTIKKATTPEQKSTTTIKGEVLSINTGNATVSITLSGDPTVITGVNYVASYFPVVGDIVLVSKQGTSIVVTGVVPDTWTPNPAIAANAAYAAIGPIQSDVNALESTTGSHTSTLSSHTNSINVNASNITSHTASISGLTSEVNALQTIDHTHSVTMISFDTSITPATNSPTSKTISGLGLVSGSYKPQVTPNTTTDDVKSTAATSPTSTSVIVWIVRDNTNATTLYVLMVQDGNPLNN